MYENRERGFRIRFGEGASGRLFGGRNAAVWTRCGCVLFLHFGTTFVGLGRPVGRPVAARRRRTRRREAHGRRRGASAGPPRADARRARSGKAAAGDGRRGASAGGRRGRDGERRPRAGQRGGRGPDKAATNENPGAVAPTVLAPSRSTAAGEHRPAARGHAAGRHGDGGLTAVHRSRRGHRGPP